MIEGRLLQYGVCFNLPNCHRKGHRHEDSIQAPLQHLYKISSKSPNKCDGLRHSALTADEYKEMVARQKADTKLAMAALAFTVKKGTGSTARATSVSPPAVSATTTAAPAGSGLPGLVLSPHKTKIAVPSAGNSYDNGTVNPVDERLDVTRSAF